MMRLNYLMLVAAICLSCVAAYYSIVGMTSIFNGALIPIIIMTGILEISKLIVTSWLYNNWKNTNNILRTYLTSAVIILMFITNIGIFGFLSKANIEQAALAEEQTAQITRIDQQIAEQQSIISDTKQQIANQGNIDSSSDSTINARIADANHVIDLVNKRIQPLIDEQQRILDQERAKIDQKISVYQKQIDELDKQFTSMSLHQQKVNLNKINQQKLDLNKKIELLRNQPNNIVDNANAEIVKIREKFEEETQQAQDTINKLTAKLTQGVDVEKSQADIDQKNIRIKNANDQIDQLNNTKFKLEGESRKLEVEVGPLKFIAQMIYGDNVDQKLLEHSVRYVILILICVFDPLAVAMLIAANQGLLNYKKQEDIKEESIIIESKEDTLPEIIQPLNELNSNKDTPLTSDRLPAKVVINEQLNSNNLNQLELINSTEDLITALQQAHSQRLNKLN